MKNFNYKDINMAIRAIRAAFEEFATKNRKTSYYDCYTNTKTETVTLVRVNGHGVKSWTAKTHPSDIFDEEIGMALVMLKAMGIQQIPPCFNGKWIRAKDLQIGEKFTTNGRFGKHEHIACGPDVNGDIIYDDEKTTNGHSIIRADAFVMI